MRAKGAMAKAGTIMAIFLLLTAATQMISGQEGRAQSEFVSIISGNPIALPFSILEAEYEKVWTPNMSLVGRVAFASQTRERYWGDCRSARFGGSVGIKRYLTPTAPEKSWYEVNVGLQYVSVECSGRYVGSVSSRGILFGITGVVGYKWVFGRLTVEPTLGMSISSSLYVQRVGETFTIKGLGSGIGVRLGYIF